jgi:hypothetical protein
MNELEFWHSAIHVPVNGGRGPRRPGTGPISRGRHAPVTDTFVFRFNRRFYRHVSFETILGIAPHHSPTSYWDIAGRDNPQKGTPRSANRRVGAKRQRA